MRKRITYIQRQDVPFELDQAVLTSDSLSIRGLDAVREERVTFGFDELSAELRLTLQQCHELHIRWATERPYDSIAPFASRISPGLHVLFTPVAADRPTELLCPLLKNVFHEGIDCLLPEISFTTPPPLLSDRFAATPAYQFHSLLPSLDNLVTFIQQNICHPSHDECRNHASTILSVDSLDIDYDSISHTLTVSGYWSQPPKGGWTETINKPESGTEQVEIGLLGNEPTTDPKDLKVGGFLAVVGKDEKLKPTLFSFPSRHHSLTEDTPYVVSFPHPTGLHPTMTISTRRSSLSRPPAPPDATCALYTYLTLPSPFFGDKYQLATTDPLFLASHNLAALRAVSGETDLEAPDWFVPRWGSTWLLELAAPDTGAPREDGGAAEWWNVTVPLHLRYLRPAASGFRSAAVPWPVVFWACATADDETMGVNPFDRVNLGWERLFGPRTTFYQLRPDPPGGDHQLRLVEEVQVPVLRLDQGKGVFYRASTVELGTMVVVVLGLLWVLWKLGLVVRKKKAGAGEKGEKRE